MADSEATISEVPSIQGSKIVIINYMQETTGKPVVIVAGTDEHLREVSLKVQEDNRLELLKAAYPAAAGCRSILVTLQPATLSPYRRVDLYYVSTAAAIHDVTCSFLMCWEAFIHSQLNSSRTNTPDSGCRHVGK